MYNLYSNPREDNEKRSIDTWVIAPVLKVVGQFNASTAKYPPIPMGTPDPYVPPAVKR
ncbi:hypothetical protein D3C80_1747020 [compost metagenome]